MVSTLTEADQLVIAALLSTALQPITERLDAISGDVAAISGDVTAISERLNDLQNDFSVVATKAHNAACSKDDTLKKVPLSDGSFPVNDCPQSVLNLIVAGNESLPNGEVNNWNARKSLDLIKEYEPGYETDENAPNLSRKRRLKLAMLLGVTSTQLNIAQLSM